jgi:hypothetical protein
MIIAIILFGAILLGMFSGFFIGIWGLVSTKLWNNLEFNFKEDLDEDDWDASFATMWMDKEKNRRGFYFLYYLSNNEWYKSLNFQWKQNFNKEIIKWRINRGIW